MKTNLFLSVVLLSVLALGCSCKKNTESKTSDSKISNSKNLLYDTIWELEHITGPRSAFKGLFPEEKPTITFKESEKTFGGNSSCNAYSGTFTKKEDTIQFGDAIKTMRFCEGGGEETYMNMFNKINKFIIDNDEKLIRLDDNIPMMRFKKIAKPQS